MAGCLASQFPRASERITGIVGQLVGVRVATGDLVRCPGSDLRFKYCALSRNLLHRKQKHAEVCNKAFEGVHMGTRT